MVNEIDNDRLTHQNTREFGCGGDGGGGGGGGGHRKFCRPQVTRLFDCKASNWLGKNIYIYKKSEWRGIYKWIPKELLSGTRNKGIENAIKICLWISIRSRNGSINRISTIVQLWCVCVRVPNAEWSRPKPKINQRVFGLSLQMIIPRFIRHIAIHMSTSTVFSF